MLMTIFGASGKVGQLTAINAWERGHEVRAFVHSHNPFEDKNRERFTVIRGDVHNRSDIERALVGSQAVISALGSWGTPDKDIVSAAVNNIVPAMETAGQRRLVTLTGNGVVWSEDRLRLQDKAARGLMGLVAPKILADGDDHLRRLAASQLDWTCVRSPAMRDAGAAEYELTMDPLPLTAWISREAVAHCLVDLAEGSEYLAQAPFITHP